MQASVTIDGIKFIIDSGFVKVLSVGVPSDCFDNTVCRRSEFTIQRRLWHR